MKILLLKQHFPFFEVTRSVARILASSGATLQLFHARVRIERNWQLERKVLKSRNVLPTRRLSVHAPAPISSPIPATIRQRRLSLPTASDGLQIDMNFVQYLNRIANADTDNEQEGETSVFHAF